jgi:hypothetical protein
MSFRPAWVIGDMPKGEPIAEAVARHRPIGLL